MQSLLLGFGETVDNIKDRAFVLIGMFTAVAYLFLAENDRVFVFHFVGDKAVVSDAHFHADFERNGGSSFFADELIDLFHARHLRQFKTQEPQ